MFKDFLNCADSNLLQHMLFKDMFLQMDSVNTFLLNIKANENIANNQYLYLEMLGELSLAHWLLKDYKKACGAMYYLVKRLHKINDFSDKYFVEVFAKTGHVLGWMAKMKCSGKPPSKSLLGEDYFEPYPGLFSRSRLKVEMFSVKELKIMSNFYLLFNMLGNFSNGCSLYRLALRAFEQAQNENPPDSIKYMIDISMAEILARLGNYTRALFFSKSGVKSQTLATYIRDNIGFSEGIGEGITFEEVWRNLPKEKRPDKIRWVYFYTLYPAVTKLMADLAPITEFQRVLSDMENIFSQDSELEDPTYWLSRIDKLKLAFSSSVTVSDLDRELSTYQKEPMFFALLSLAFCLIPTGLLKVKCQLQGEVFDFFVQCLSVMKLVVEYTSDYIIKFWKNILVNESSNFQHSQDFRNFVLSIQSPTIPNVSKLLLQSAKETKAFLATDIVDRLRSNCSTT